MTVVAGVGGLQEEDANTYGRDHAILFHVSARREHKNTQVVHQRASHAVHLPFGFGTCQFLWKLEPVKLPVQGVVTRAFQTSRRLSFPFCSPLSSLELIVESVSPKSYISANCQFSSSMFFSVPAPGLLLFWNRCVYGCCPFASARDAQDGGLRVPVMQHAQ